MTFIRSYDTARYSDRELAHQVEIDETAAKEEIGSGAQRKTTWDGRIMILTWSDPGIDALNAKSDKIAAATTFVKAHREGQRMGKLAEVAGRIKAHRKLHDEEGDALAAKMDELEKSAPDIFSGAHAFVDSLKSDQQDMENDLRALSNLPLSEQGTGD